MKTTAKIYRWLLPLFLVAVFSLTLYGAQIIPPSLGEEVYDWSLLLLAGLFSGMLVFGFYSDYRSGELLYRSRANSTNKIFLILGLMFLVFSFLVGGMEMYLQEVIHGSYPAGPFLILASAAGFAGWRLSLSVYDNGVRPPCRSFIAREKIQSFLFLTEASLFTECLFPPGGEINFEVPAADAPEVFRHFLFSFPLQKLEPGDFQPPEDLGGVGIIGFYLSTLEEGDSLKIEKDGGLKTNYRSQEGEASSENWSEAEFARVKKLFYKLASRASGKEEAGEEKIEFERLRKKRDGEPVSCSITVIFAAENDFIKLKFDTV